MSIPTVTAATPQPSAAPVPTPPPGHGTVPAQAGAQQPPVTPDAAGEGADKGFPEHTPVAAMTPEQQAAYWREQHKVEQRKRAAYGNLTENELAELRRKAEELDTLTAASQTDQQRAVAEAEARTRAAVRAEFAGKLVDASITAAVAGRVPGEQLATTLAPLDRSWFLTEAGDVDPDKVAAYASQLAGAAAAPVPPTSPPNHGAGYRPGVAPSGADAGREMARRRFGAPQQ